MSVYTEPRCEAHGLKVTACVPCCVLIFEKAGDMNPDLRHSWAVANVYEEKEKW